MRELLRSLLAMIFALLAIFSLIVLFFGLFGWRQQRQHDLEIQVAFDQAAKFISEFSASNERLPLETEFSTWVATQPLALGTSVHKVSYQKRRPPKELTDTFGAPRGESYYLEIWRGEWSEYYASWVNRSTIEPSDFKWFLQLYFPMVGFGLVFLTGFSYMSYKLIRSGKIATKA